MSFSCSQVNPSLGRERSVSRSRDPSQRSRGNSSARTDPFAYIPDESNSDSLRKYFYDRRRDAENSRERGHDYGDYGKDRTVITSGIKSRISAAETAVTFGALAETICRIAAVTPRKEWTIKRGAQRMRGTRMAVKTRRKDAANPLQPHRARERTINQL
jgi:hypothetical protein